jgi:hypothetical protein
MEEIGIWNGTDRPSELVAYSEHMGHLSHLPDWCSWLINRREVGHIPPDGTFLFSLLPQAQLSIESCFLKIRLIFQPMFFKDQPRYQPLKLSGVG